MCGICGVLYFDGTPPDINIVTAMNDRLFHRGPDQGRVLVDGSCALGNRRLAILDLSPAGNLPMQSADSRFTMAYNGEVYNHLELRPSLEAGGVRFRSTSDAETMLELYRREEADLLRHLRGMFALALWDNQARTLLLARDRLGKKPLYYYHDQNILVFASEIKALLVHPAVPRESALDPHTLALYLGYGYIPAPQTALKHIKALLPGHMILVRDGQVNPVAYWTPPLTSGAESVSEKRETEYVEAVRDTLEEAVRLRLLSDVPLGAFLSGGLDSSLIVALMRKHSSATVKTFSIGFAGDDSFDETPFAKQVAQVLDTDHTAFTVQPQALELLPKLVWHHDQPFADSSAIPSFLVSQLTRQQVTVALTGDGGDELFAGYERFYAASLRRKLNLLPRPVWKSLAGALKLVPEGTGYYNLAKRARRFLNGASLPFELAYFDWIRLFNAETVAALTGQSDHAAAHFSGIFSNGTRHPDPMTALLDVNLRTYLPDDLMIKADRCSMAASLEARAPFLDHPLVELAATIPYNLKLKGGVTKHILKQAARGLLPDDIIDRPKHGFGVPLGAWLRKDMAPVREVLLSPEARGRGLLKIQAVEDLITEHASGKRDHGQRLWTLLTLESWHRQFIDTPTLVTP